MHGVSLFSTSCQHLFSLIYSIIAIPTGVSQYLVVLICISLMISKVEHLLMNLLAIVCVLWKSICSDSISISTLDVLVLLSSCMLLLLLLLLLSCFSRVRFCATPETAAHQAPPSLGFSRQEHWSGLPFPSPMQESEK